MKNKIIKTKEGLFKTLERSLTKNGYHAYKLSGDDKGTRWINDKFILEIFEITEIEKHKTDDYFVRKYN